MNARDIIKRLRVKWLIIGENTPSARRTIFNNSSNLTDQNLPIHHYTSVRFSSILIFISISDTKNNNKINEKWVKKNEEKSRCWRYNVSLKIISTDLKYIESPYAMGDVVLFFFRFYFCFFLFSFHIYSDPECHCMIFVRFEKNAFVVQFNRGYIK